MARCGPSNFLLWLAILLGFLASACSLAPSEKRGDVPAHLDDSIDSLHILPNVHARTARGLLSTTSRKKVPKVLSSKEQKANVKVAQKAWDKAHTRLTQYEARNEARKNLRHSGEAVKKDFIKPRPKAETGMKHVGWK